MLTALALLAFADAAESFRIELPIACEIGRDCFLQQYPDRDPSTGAKDYACGPATYDGHDGVDIRVQTLADVERGVAALAVAPGVVKATRDGTPDRLIASAADRAAVKDKECGNGVVIDHGRGWETQLCHLKRGSVAVAKGATVAAGDRLGEIGYSGLAQFPHVHLSVRRNGASVDPFAPEQAAAACGPGANALWSVSARERLAYSGGDLIGFGFADKALTLGDLANQTPAAPDAASPALVAYAWAINLRKGDRIRVTLAGPGGELAANETTLDRNKAQYFLFAGKKLTAPVWRRGKYAARVEIDRAGAPFISRSETIDLR